MRNKANNTNVNLVTSYDFEGWKSMQVYRDLVLSGFAEHPELGVSPHLVKWEENGRPNKLGRYMAKYVKAKAILAELDTDIIHHMDHGYAHLVTKKQRSVVTVHDLTHFEAPGIGPLDLWFWRKRMQKLKDADQLVTVSSNVADLLMKFLNISSRNVTVGYYEINTENFLKVDKNEARVKWREDGKEVFTVCSVGTVHPKKNLGTLLDAIEILHNDGIRVKLVRIGDLFSQGSIDWAKKAERLSSLGLLKEHGQMSHHEVGQIMASTDAFVFPSSYEGFGMPIMEAQALKLPLVVANASCLPEIAGEGRLMFETENAMELANQLKKIRAGEAEVHESVERGLENTKRFEPGSHVKVLKSVYDKFS